MTHCRCLKLGCLDDRSRLFWAPRPWGCCAAYLCFSLLAPLCWLRGLRSRRFLSFQLARWLVLCGSFCWAPWLVVCLLPAFFFMFVCVCLCAFSLCLLGCVCCLVLLFAVASLASSFLVGLARSGACAALRVARLSM
jgi:hypothetical protein